MIVDLHAHLFHPKWYPARFCRSLASDYVRRIQEKGRTQDLIRAEETVTRMLSDETGALTLRQMDKVGIDKKIILVIDWGVQLGEAPCPIDDIQKAILSICAKSNGRLLGYAGIDPRRPNAAELMERAFDLWGAKGVKLHPTGSWKLSDESTHEVVSVSVVRKCPVLVHVGQTLDILDDINAQPKALIDLARAFPNGRFIAGHSGFELFTAFVEEPNPPSNLYFDISGWQPLVHNDKFELRTRLEKLMKAFPARVCYGSDSPFFTYNLVSSEKSWLDLVKETLSTLPEDLRREEDAVLGGQNLI